MFGRLFPSATHPELLHGTLQGAGRVYVRFGDDGGRLVKQVHRRKVYRVHACPCGGKACHFCAACGREQLASDAGVSVQSVPSMSANASAGGLGSPPRTGSFGSTQ
jgi:hypothetical protein